MNGRIFKISMKTGWNRKLSTTWKNWISQKRKSGWPITVNTFWKRSNMKMLRAGKSVLSLRKSDHDIQKLVVKMKDELEKIKEQSLNVL